MHSRANLSICTTSVSTEESEEAQRGGKKCVSYSRLIDLPLEMLIRWEGRDRSMGNSGRVLVRLRDARDRIID